MLTKEEEERISHEEIFRQEVREKLEKSKKPRSVGAKIWSIVNTSFGIWLLSTMVVGLFTWAYTNWEQSRTKEQDKNELIRKLDIEIASRLRNLESLLDSVSTASGYYRAMQLLGKPDTSVLASAVVFPEFQDRPLRSLIWELQQQIPPEEKAEVNKALRALQNLTDIDYVSKLGNMNGDAPLTPALQTDMKDAKESLNQSIKLKRWQTPES